jgi:hypothetical protein
MEIIITVLIAGAVLVAALGGLSTYYFLHMVGYYRTHNRNR